MDMDGEHSLGMGAQSPIVRARTEGHGETAAVDNARLERKVDDLTERVQGVDGVDYGTAGKTGL